MDPARWQRLRRLFDRAAALEPADRAAYLEEACADDPELRREVLELLQNEQPSRDPVGEAVLRAAEGVARGGIVELESGSRLGRYTILRKLGQGGMGAVYMAEDSELRRKVALKVLSGWHTEDATALQRFQREAQVLATLSHPNIVTIYSVEHENGFHFLTTELVEGQTLDRLIPAAGFAVEQLLDLAIPLAQALAAAHGRGVTHRDLKPANVMVSGARDVKVLDFGLAKLRQEGPEDEESRLPSDSLTVTGVVIGTVPYMSPEQVEGKPLGPRSDIFSLGVILYELASGARPFSGDSSAALISSILKEEPSPISAIRPQLPSRLTQLITRCLDKDPDKRCDAIYLVRELVQLREAIAHHPGITRGLRRLSALFPRIPRSRLAIPAVALASLLVIVGGRYFGAVPWRGSRPPAVPRIASLAVLPLTNLSGDDDQEYLADGMTEVLITELSKIGALKVISRTSAMRFKETDLSLDEIAERLGVDAVVEGSVLRSENRVRVTAQLIHAASDEHLWADSFERDLSDLLALQGELARIIALQVSVTLTPEEQARLTRGETVDPRASEAYLRGRHYWNQFAFGQAGEAFQEAIDLDPSFARAYAGLAKTRQMQGVVGVPHPPRISYPLAQAAATRALELDGELAEAHAAQGWIALNFHWDWETARREFGRALELNPGDADARMGSSYYLSAMGRFEEAVAAAEKARELDPLSRLGNVSLCEILYYAREYERALFQLAEEWDGTFLPTFWIYDRLLQARGDPDAAAWASLRGARLGAYPKPLVVALEEALSSSGPDAYWREMLTFHLSWPQEAILAKVVAETYTRLGETDRAFDWIERAYERRDPITHLGVDPIWDPLRSDPRFDDLLRRMNLSPISAGDSQSPRNLTARKQS